MTPISPSVRPPHVGLWVVVIAVFIWSYVGYADRLTWVLEVFPVVLGSGAILLLYPHFRFTTLVCWFLAAHAIVLMIGGHYTYANVPPFNWIRDRFHLARNDYDRLGHFFQGFVPALIAREVLIRRGVVKRGPWLNFIVICICLAISATYELFEWQAAVWSGSKADAFLGTQGDPWDTQEDMAMAIVGAVTALITLSHFHNNEIARINEKS